MSKEGSKEVSTISKPFFSTEKSPEKSFNSHNVSNSNSDMELSDSCEKKIIEEVEETHLPVVKGIGTKQYIVGSINYTERNASQIHYEEIQEYQEECLQSVHLYPPKAYLIDFMNPLKKLKTEGVSKKKDGSFSDQELLEMNYSFDYQNNLQVSESLKRKYNYKDESQNLQKNIFYDQFGLWIEQNTIGDILLEKEKQYLYDDIFEKFYYFLQQYPPCCDRTYKFWKHTLLLNPKSGFKWSFKNYNFLFLDYLTDFIEFREVFGNWLDSYEAVIVSAYGPKPESLKIAKLFFQFLRQMVNLKNLYLINEVQKNPKNEYHQKINKDCTELIKNNGIHLKPIKYDKKQDNCHESANISSRYGRFNFIMPHYKAKRTKKININIEQHLFKFKVDPQPQIPQYPIY